MGEAAAPGADVVVVTDDNPRTEDPATVRAAVRAGAEAAGAATVFEVADRREAIADAVRLAGPGDVVAVLGKGHERGQETADRDGPVRRPGRAAAPWPAGSPTSFLREGDA